MPPPPGSVLAHWCSPGACQNGRPTIRVPATAGAPKRSTLKEGPLGSTGDGFGRHHVTPPTPSARRRPQMPSRVQPGASDGKPARRLVATTPDPCPVERRSCLCSRGKALITHHAPKNTGQVEQSCCSCVRLDRVHTVSPECAGRIGTRRFVLMCWWSVGRLVHVRSYAQAGSGSRWNDRASPAAASTHPTAAPTRHSPDPRSPHPGDDGPTHRGSQP